MRVNTYTPAIRVEINREQFLDIKEIDGYKGYACEISALGVFNYSALLKCNCYDPIRLFIFPSKVWFDEWYESLKEKPEVIYQFGKVTK